MRLLRFCFSLSALLIIFLGCSYRDAAETDFVNELEVAIRTTVVNQNLRIAAINKGDWNKLFIFSPYTPLAEIETVLKTPDSSEIKSIKINERDDINLFVFLKNENIQMIVTVPRSILNISISKEVQPLHQGNAVFKKTEGHTFALAN